MAFSVHRNLASYASTTSLPTTNIHIYDSNAGAQTIMLLHGLGDDADTWAHVFPVLVERGYRVIALDWPGSGRSTSTRKVTIDQHYATFVALLNSLDIRHFHLVGHSMGAMIAHRFTAEHPGMVMSMTLLGGMLGTEQRELSLPLLLSLIPGIGELRYTRLRRDPDAAFQSLNTYYADVNALSDYDRDFLYKRVNERVWSNAHRKAYFSLLRSLPGWLKGATDAVMRTQHSLPPMTVAFGEKDVVVAPDAAKTAASRLGIPFHIVSHAGHNVQQEQPETVVNYILDTVNRSGGQATVSDSGSVWTTTNSS